MAHWFSPHAFTIRGPGPGFHRENLVQRMFMNLVSENIDLAAGFHMLLIDG